MARRRRQTRHGATQPETDRLRKQVLLRLLPVEAERLDRLAADRGVTRSAYVERLLRAADGVDPGE